MPVVYKGLCKIGKIQRFFFLFSESWNIGLSRGKMKVWNLNLRMKKIVFPVVLYRRVPTIVFYEWIIFLLPHLYPVRNWYKINRYKSITVEQNYDTDTLTYSKRSQWNIYECNWEFTWTSNTRLRRLNLFPCFLPLRNVHAAIIIVIFAVGFAVCTIGHHWFQFDWFHSTEFLNIRFVIVDQVVFYEIESRFRQSISVRNSANIFRGAVSVN